MDCEYPHLPFTSVPRRSQSLRNDRCQNILYKAVFEHFKEIKDIAALLLTSKSFQNSSFGANFLVNFFVDGKAILLLESLLCPSSCFSLQFVPSLHINQSWGRSKKLNRGISNFVAELANTKYLHLSLRSLVLDRVTSEVLSCFFGSSTNSWPHLLDLTLDACDPVSDTVLEIIAKNAVQLRAVNFCNDLKITDIGLQHISKLSNITFLNLTDCRMITDEGLEHISELSNIRSLNLSYCKKITGTGLEHVSNLSNITLLNLAGCDGITDVGLEHVANLAGITSLNLYFCRLITDGGLEHVANLKRITWLDLTGCKLISDAGLQHLTKLCSITTLDLFLCDKITAEAKEKLKIALPNCDIRD